MHWYKFTFADGYTVTCMALDKLEKATLEREHGKLKSKKKIM